MNYLVHFFIMKLIAETRYCLWYHIILYYTKFMFFSLVTQCYHSRLCGLHRDEIVRTTVSYTNFII